MLLCLCDNKVRNSVLKTVSTTVSYSLLTRSTMKSSWYGLRVELMITCTIWTHPPQWYRCELIDGNLSLNNLNYLSFLRPFLHLLIQIYCEFIVWSWWKCYLFSSDKVNTVLWKDHVPLCRLRKKTTLLCTYLTVLVVYLEATIIFSSSDCKVNSFPTPCQVFIIDAARSTQRILTNKSSKWWVVQKANVITNKITINTTTPSLLLIEKNIRCYDMVQQ